MAELKWCLFLEPRAHFNLIHKFNLFSQSVFIKSVLHFTPWNYYTHDPVNKDQPFHSQGLSIIHIIYSFFICHTVSAVFLSDLALTFYSRTGNTEAYGNSRSFTHRRSHSIGFGVYEASDLCEVTVALGDKLNCGGLHEEGIVRCEDALNALLHILDHHRLPPAVHKLPHLVIGGDFCLLQATKE